MAGAAEEIRACGDHAGAGECQITRGRALRIVSRRSESFVEVIERQGVGVRNIFAGPIQREQTSSLQFLDQPIQMAQKRTIAAHGAARPAIVPRVHVSSLSETTQF